MLASDILLAVRFLLKDTKRELIDDQGLLAIISEAVKEVSSLLGGFALQSLYKIDTNTYQITLPQNKIQILNVLLNSKEIPIYGRNLGAQKHEYQYCYESLFALIFNQELNSGDTVEITSKSVITVDNENDEILMPFYVKKALIYYCTHHVSLVNISENGQKKSSDYYILYQNEISNIIARQAKVKNTNQYQSRYQRV